MRTLKTMGAAVIAVLALSALAASTASATYDSEAETTTLQGSQSTQNVVSNKWGTIKCNKAAFTGSQKGTKQADGAYTAPEITVVPVYEECTAFGVAATVTTTGCSYTFTTATTTPLDESWTSHAQMHLTCEAGKAIVYKLGGCEMKFKAQTPGGVVKFMNEGSGKTRDVHLRWEVTGIHAEGTGLLCNGTDAAGTYTGDVTVKGFNSENKQVGIWVT